MNWPSVLLLTIVPPRLASPNVKVMVVVVEATDKAVAVNNSEVEVEVVILI